MSEEPWIEMARTWGLTGSSVVQVAEARATAIHWRHNARMFPDAAVQTNLLCYALQPGRSRLWRGSRSSDAAMVQHSAGLVPRGTYGVWEFDDPHESLHVQVPDEFLAELAERSGYARAPVLDERLCLDDPVLNVLLGEVAEAMRTGEQGKLYVEVLGATIGMRLIRRHSDLADRLTPSNVKGGLAPWQIRRLTDHLEERLAEDVSLGDLSKLLDLSTFHLCRAFKQSTGLPPHRWRHQRRLERARELLEGTDLPVTEVAAQVGYDDPSQLAAAFRKALGVSPSQYRRERRS